MDKLRLTGHIKDIELKNKMFRVIDKANSCLKNYDLKITEFMNPYEIRNAEAILNSEQNLRYTSDGGYEEAERKLVFIYPFYMDYDDIDDKLRYLQIDGNFKFKSVSHKDYLGSILGLGIKREKIGDILIHENFCQVIVSPDIADFILINLEKVSRNNVSVREISREDILLDQKKYKEIGCTISSDRLDCVISGIYNISRRESLKYIKADRVHLNYEPISSSSRSVSAGDLVSVRGKGRAEVIEIGDITKKGRIKLKAKILI